MHHMEVGKLMKTNTTGIFGTGEVYISSPQHWDPHPAGGLQRALQPSTQLEPRVLETLIVGCHKLGRYMMVAQCCSTWRVTVSRPMRTQPVSDKKFAWFCFTPQKLTVEPRNKIQVWKMTFLFFERGLLMKEIPNNHLGCIKLCNGINYLLPGLPDFWTINCILGRFQPLVFRVCVFTLQTWSQVGCLSVRSSVLSLQPVPLGAANRGSGIADGDGKNLMFFVPW